MAMVGVFWKTESKVLEIVWLMISVDTTKKGKLSHITYPKFLGETVVSHTCW